jgi:hypothetical protein
MMRRRSILACSLVLMLVPSAGETAGPGGIELRPHRLGSGGWFPFEWWPGARVPSGTDAIVEFRGVHAASASWREAGRTKLERSQRLCHQGNCVGLVDWDTAPLREGRYRVRVTIPATGYASASVPIRIDHTPPEVTITEPEADAVSPTGEPIAMLAGAIRFEGSVHSSDPDGPYFRAAGRSWPISDCCRFYRWTIRNLATGDERTFSPFEPCCFQPATFDFSRDPGLYRVTFEIPDAVGNLGSDSLLVLGR